MEGPGSWCKRSWTQCTDKGGVGNRVQCILSAKGVHGIWSGSVIWSSQCRSSELGPVRQRNSCRPRDSVRNDLDLLPLITRWSIRGWFQFETLTTRTRRKPAPKPAPAQSPEVLRHFEWNPLSYYGLRVEHRSGELFEYVHPLGYIILTYSYFDVGRLSNPENKEVTNHQKYYQHTHGKFPVFLKSVESNSELNSLAQIYEAYISQTEVGSLFVPPPKAPVQSTDRELQNFYEGYVSSVVMSS